MLLLALSLELGGLLFDALAEAGIPVLGDLVGNDLDRVGWMDFPVAWEGRLSVWNADKAVCENGTM